jgi:hypothetical protein
LKAAGCDVIYFYFDFKSAQVQTRMDVTRALLKQIACQSNVSPELEKLYDKYGHLPQSPPLNEVLECLHEYSRSFLIHVILDALDEWDDCPHTEIYPLLVELQKSWLRLLVSSRPYLQHDLQTHLKDHEVLTISSDEADVRNYITYRIAKEKRTNSELKNRFLELGRSAKGMYVILFFRR